jgi:hypothetical protein
LERIAFKDWVIADSEQSKLFWIYGPPGFGKSVLAASIIHQLQTEEQTTLAYFFCASEDHAKSEPCAILTSWIAQLMQQSVEAGDIACRVFGPDEQHVISWAEKWKCFRALCQELPSCTFVIDGFDECKNITKTSKYCIDDGRSKFLRELIQAAAETKSRILLISRDCADVRAEVNRAEESNWNITFSFYKIIEEDTRRDIQIFSKQVVDLKLSKKKWTRSGRILRNERLANPKACSFGFTCSLGISIPAGIQSSSRTLLRRRLRELNKLMSKIWSRSVKWKWVREKKPLPSYAGSYLLSGH